METTELGTYQVLMKTSVPCLGLKAERRKELATSWLPDILSPHHSKLPLMIVTSQLDPGHLWASFSLQWHFYGSSVIHLLIHSYTRHHFRVPGTRLGTGETMMSKTQPSALKEPWSSGGRATAAAGRKRYLPEDHLVRDPTPE